MRIEKQNTTETIYAELARRLVQKRISLGITQEKAAEQAGIGVRTLRRIEFGCDCNFLTIIRLLQTYNAIDGLENLLPETIISPVEYFAQQQRKKVTFRAVNQAPKTNLKTKRKPWKWGDEQ